MFCVRMKSRPLSTLFTIVTWSCHYIKSYNINNQISFEEEWRSFFYRHSFDRLNQNVTTDAKQKKNNNKNTENEMIIYVGWKMPIKLTHIQMDSSDFRLTWCLISVAAMVAYARINQLTTFEATEMSFWIQNIHTVRRTLYLQRLLPCYDLFNMNWATAIFIYCT